MLTVFAVFLFCFSKMPFCPYPSFWQLSCVCVLVAVIMLVSKCLLRNFVYRVSVCESGAWQGRPELTVFERYGKRSAVVCRIALSDIAEITAVTEENRHKLAKTLHGATVYRYYSELFPTSEYLLQVHCGDETAYIRIIADQALLQWLQK